MEKKRVVITGLGIVAPNGIGKEVGQEILDTALLGKLMDKLVNDADRRLYISKEVKFAAE